MTRAAGAQVARQAVVLLAILLAMAATVEAQAGEERRGCGGTAFAFQNPDLFPVISPAVPVPLVSLLLTHACPGPVYVRGHVLLILEPVPPDGATVLVFPRATCLGGGCGVTGDPIGPAPGSTTLAFRGAGLGDTGVSLPVLGVFPDLPPGTYQVEVVAAGINAQAIPGSLHVIDGGRPAGTGRPRAP